MKKTWYLPITFNKGFSLIEVLLVVLVAGIILVVLANLTPAFKLLQTSSRENVARQIVSKKIEDIRTQGYDNLANGSSNFTDTRLNQLPQATAITLIEDCPSTICSNNEPIKQVSINVQWNENNQSKNFSITTLIAKGGIR
jgi:prepilin-type N-terminal cleavage/methylation domain-containing protein